MKAIITGGSSGLGYEIAKQLLERGISVILIGRSKEKLEKAKNQLYEIKTEAGIEDYAFDIADQKSVADFFELMRNRRETISYLFNVAGSSYFGMVEEITYDTVIDTLRSNMIGLMLITAGGVKHFRDFPAPKHRIVSILSTAALKGKKNESVYNAAKWGARGFLESVRDETANTNIEIINVYPGGMKTPFWNNSTSGYDIESFMEAESVARQVAGIAVDCSTCITDVTINRPKQR